MRIVNADLFLTYNHKDRGHQRMKIASIPINLSLPVTEREVDRDVKLDIQLFSDAGMISNLQLPIHLETTEWDALERDRRVNVTVK